MIASVMQAPQKRYLPNGEEVPSNRSSHHSDEQNMENLESSVSMSGFKPDKGANLESINDLIHEPICSGFLFKYCEAFYCSEHIRFVMEVDKYRDYFQTENMFWLSSWKQVDLDLALQKFDISYPERVKETIAEVQALLDSETLTVDAKWPSTRVSRTGVESMMKHIWETFLSDSAKFQICMPSRVLWKTLQRMKNVHLYGKDVFQEALYDPIKTIFRDIYPRFRNSEHMKMLRQRMRECEDLPPSSALVLPPLPNLITSRYTMKELHAETKLTFQDMLEDKICFKEFFRYLQSCIVSENLRFIRALQVYKEHIISTDDSLKRHGVEWAWTIYKFFIAPYSAYEISVSHTARRDVMCQLADPTVNTFDVIERYTLDLLRVHFNTFRNKKEYTNMNAVILQTIEFNNPNDTSSEMVIVKTSRTIGCFGLC